MLQTILNRHGADFASALAILLVLATWSDRRHVIDYQALIGRRISFIAIAAVVLVVIWAPLS